MGLRNKKMNMQDMARKRMYGITRKAWLGHIKRLLKEGNFRSQKSR